MIFATALFAWLTLAGTPDAREEAIRSTQGDVEGYAYDTNVGLRRNGVTWGIVDAVGAGRCRTKFLLEEDHAVTVDWSAVTGVRGVKYEVELLARKPADTVAFELDLEDQARNFGEVFAYLVDACRG
ncbi:hypothetical protein E2493_15815 [Sphingomonas parva]|uniref:Uncharacterized protein n=1 Tax=Sphingomonas parva TaxID=2555898 RepID=A0A4Y8ZMV7_9SPHN|nr:hypothetical protein [Sphingomonas parva]TFI57330.1 hypothetical protein E2493_15815 [Sphingomonas parva]